MPSYYFKLLPFSSEVSLRFAEEEPLATASLLELWSEAGFQDRFRPRWESELDGSVTYRSACSLKGLNIISYS